MQKYALLPLTLFLFSCSSATEKPVCEAGRQLDCTCTSGVTGSQTCKDDGSGWEECVCDCIKNCTGRECGEDPVCGESCGTCDLNSTCNVSGVCECDFLDCEGTCCADGQVCSEGSCCTPNCGTRECGPDPLCGTSCGNCDSNEFCSPDGLCQTALHGTYLDFHGGTDNASVPNNASLIVDGQLTIEAWITFQGGTLNPRIVEIIDTYNLHILRSTERLGFELYSAGWTTVYDSEEFPQNTWVHVAGSWDGSTMRLFRNGVLVGSAEFAGPLNHNGPGDQSLKIGNGWTLIDGFIGGIFLVRVSDVARYTTDFDPPTVLESDAHTVGLWLCDEGQGAVAHDSSTNANHANITGAAWANDGP